MKYHNKKTEYNGIVFDSKKECDRYIDLKCFERAGEITELTCQPVFKYLECEKFTKKARKVLFKYIADFSYYDKAGNYHVEDVKSEFTAKQAVFRLKKKLIEDQYPILIEIV